MQETILKIRVLGDPVLRQKAKPVAEVTAQERQILSRMAQLMYEVQGIGLASPQVGLDRALIVVDIGTGLYKLANPRIVKKEGSQAIEEGCLSVPGLSVKVKRAKSVRITALDADSKVITIDAQGLLACVFQHEIDHLNARLIIDYASVLTRLKMKKKMEKLNERMPEPEKKSARL